MHADIEALIRVVVRFTMNCKCSDSYRSCPFNLFKRNGDVEIDMELMRELGIDDLKAKFLEHLECPRAQYALPPIYFPQSKDDY